MSRICFVPGCNTGRYSDRKKCTLEGTKVKSLFLVPNNADIFEKWKNALPSVGEEFTKNSAVCELHFNADDIERQYVTTLKDGTVHKILRYHPTVRKGAVPCIFPNFQGDIENCSIKRLAHEQETAIGKKQKIETEMLDVNNREETDEDAENKIWNDRFFVWQTVADDKSGGLSTKISEFDFRVLLENFDSIKKPNDFWGAALTEKYLVFSKWTLDYVPDRRVIIYPDLSVKIYLKDSQIEAPGDMKVNSFDDISTLLDEIDELSLCKRVPQGTPKKCLLYLPAEEVLQEKADYLCEECKNIKQQLEVTEECEETQESDGIPIKNIQGDHRQLLRKFCSTRRKNFRLKKKIATLNETLIALNAKPPSEDDNLDKDNNTSVVQSHLTSESSNLECQD